MVATRTHLEHYLDFYLKTENPRFALLVTGVWGTGKTFQVIDALSNSDHAYVSLYGLRSPHEIHQAVQMAMDPKMAKTKEFLDELSTSTEKSGGTAGLLGYFLGKAGSAFNAAIDCKKTLIFDDLERCGLDLSDVLGVINSYLEHQKCRVIVITDDTNLNFLSKSDACTEDRRSTKEKIFGQTIRITPRISDAFDAFTKDLQIISKSFIETHKRTILSVFSKSDVGSLRILRHVVGDLARFFPLVDKAFLENEAALKELVGLFCAFDIETRKERMGGKDLQNRNGAQSGYEMSKYISKETQPEKPPILVAEERYTFLNLEGDLLQDKLLVDLFVNGIYDKEAINDSLAASTFFKVIEDAPPWKVLLSFDSVEDSIVEAKLNAFNSEFTDRKNVETGPLLHIFALKLMMAENSICDQDAAQAEADCMEYIDDLVAAKTLPARPLKWDWKHDYYNAFDDSTYWVGPANKDSFCRIQVYLFNKMEDMLDIEYKGAAQELLSLMESNGEAFFSKICATFEGDNPYTSIPILHLIKPEDFVNTWLKSDPKHWYWIRGGLRTRYENTSRINDDLLKEKDWRDEMKKLFEAETEKKTGFAKFRMQRSVPDWN